MGLDGRVALVTGGGRGIGAAICLALAEDGADVAVNYRRSADEAAEVVAAIEKLGRKAIAVQAAVEDADAGAAMIDRVAGELGGLSILVHNAGIASRGRSIADTDADEPGRLLANHALGPFRLTQRAIPHLRAAGAGGGRADVVFISSVATKHMAAFGAPYNMAKAAMEALALTLAKEERNKGVHVNVVAPGLVRTEMGRRLVKAWGVDIDTMDPGSPFGRVCTPEDVANVVRWVVSDGAGYVTGERIQVDGGGT